jgi:hypothetical protein
MTTFTLRRLTSVSDFVIWVSFVIRHSTFVIWQPYFASR